MTSTVRVRAPAKINLYLHVVGRRPDGYHLLDSLVAFVDIGDEIIAQAADGLSLAIQGPYGGHLQADDDNLVLRAARGLADICGVPGGADLTLVKNLPIAAGLGGGSSDAAATIEALLALWKMPPDPDRIDALALSLGADVPVCRLGTTAHMSGIGEILAPAPELPQCGVVLANPNRPLSTPSVFAARQGEFSDPDPIFETPRTAGRLADALASRRNDLHAAAAGLVPEIDQLIDCLAEDPTCLLARLSGSGPSCFALYADRGAADRAAERLAAKKPDWWVRAGSFVSGAVR